MYSAYDFTRLRRADPTAKSPCMAGRGRRNTPTVLPTRPSLALWRLSARGPAGHDVYSLRKGLHQRHEPDFLRYCLHLRGTILVLGWIFYGGAARLGSALNSARPM